MVLIYPKDTIILIKYTKVQNGIWYVFYACIAMGWDFGVNWG
jgi:hypothetical protein